MTDPRIATGPLKREPFCLFLPPADRLLLLEEALGQVHLGAWDRRIIDWLTNLDTSTVLTVASLIQRARMAEAAALAGELAGLRKRGSGGGQ
jgi:hypothetical protein